MAHRCVPDRLKETGPIPFLFKAGQVDIDREKHSRPLPSGIVIGLRQIASSNVGEARTNNWSLGWHTDPNVSAEFDLETQFLQGAPVRLTPDEGHESATTVGHHVL